MGAILLETTLLPPLARFFIALFVTLVVTIGTVLFTYWLSKGK